MKSVSVDSVRYDVIERCSKISDPKTRDIGVKNKWNRNWLQERDFSENEDFLSDYIVKINKPGAAYCLYCNIDIAYGSSGKRNLRKHAQRNEKHAEQRKIRVTNMALPLLFFEPTDSTIQEKTCSLRRTVHQLISMIKVYVLERRSFNHSLSSVLLIGSPL